VVAGDPGARADRLLVLGAGPAQLGLLAAARARELHVIAVDRDPSAPGFRYADRRAILSTEDEPGIERLAGAERVDGVIAPGIDISVVDIADRILAALDKPESLKAFVPERPGQVDRHIGSTEKMERLTGWRARVSFDEGLERTIAWYRENEAWWRGISESRAARSSS